MPSPEGRLSRWSSLESSSSLCSRSTRCGAGGSPVAARLSLRFAALGYLAALLALPVGLVFWRTFENGLAPLWNALVDLPFALSPVVIGLALYLVYARTGWFGGWLVDHGINVIFALPGMILATIFVSLPFVVRETVPVLREIGTEQEEAAWTLGASPLTAFFRVTLPAIRWGVTYGIVLTTARAIGEFGAVSIVSGSIAGRTETLTLHVQQRFQGFDLTGAYTASVELALLALITLLFMTLLRKETPVGDSDTPGDEALR